MRGEIFFPLIYNKGDIVLAKVTYEYQGKSRPEMKGTKKSYDKKDLNPKKLDSLDSKGWVEVKAKPKAKSKKKESK